MTTKGRFSLCLAFSLLAIGCADSNGEYDDVDARNAEIVENLLAAGFSADEIEIRDAEHMGEDLMLEFAPQVFIDGDTHVTLEASRELAGEVVEDTFRMWRTPNLVNNNTTICLAKVTSAQAPYTSYALTSAMQAGVDAASINLNQLTSFNLNMVTGNASLGSDGALSHAIVGCTYSIFLYQVAGGAGGQAGFPAGGAPYNQVQLYSGLTGYSADVHEHVATHEVSHAIGLRHSDWKTRASCGQNSNEGQSGAVQIAGTTDQTTNSIMASCFAANTNGEFRGEDATAYNAIY